MLRLLRCMFALLCCSMATLAHADLLQGYQYLLSHQQASGSVVGSVEIAHAPQATYEAIQAQTLAGAAAVVDASVANTFLHNSAWTDTETLAQNLIQGNAINNSGQAIAGLLLARMNQDGGFGDADGFQSTPFDTYWAVTALDVAGQLSTAKRSAALGYLLRKQKTDGSWSYQADSSVYLTARVVSLLSRNQNIAGVTSALSKATQSLLGTVDASTHLVGGNVFNTAIVLWALADTNNASALQPVSVALLSQQQADGSWAEDVWTTALSLQSLLKWNAQSNATGLASISGRIVVSGTTQPIPGAIISVVGQPVQVIAGADGRFTLSGLKGGSINLAVTAAGYSSVSAGATLGVSQALNIGDIAMSPGNNSNLLSGHIYDDSTGLPIGNANITLQGSIHAVTDAQGNFVLTGLAVGSYTVAISANGYRNYAGVISLESGQSQMRQGMLQAGTVLDSQSGNLTGRMVDGNTGAAIAGASILLGASAVQTASDGRFTFVNVARGSYNMQASATGFASGVFTFTFSPGSTGNLGDLSLFATSSNVAATNTTLTVSVVDAVNQHPIADATVSVGSVTVQSNAAGQAVQSGITNLAFTLDVQATGYLAVQNQVTTSGLGSVSVTIPLTPIVPPATAVTLSGTVTDANNLPVANAAIEIVGVSHIVTSTDSAGHYTLSDITDLSFVVRATASGYTTAEQAMQLQAYGQYSLDIQLQPASTEFNVISVTAQDKILSANQATTVQAVVQNLTAQTQSVIVRGLVFDANNAQIAVLPVYLPDTQTLTGNINFAENQTLTLTLPWNSQQWTAGGYSVRVDVVLPGSITRSLPNGNILASGVDLFTITGSAAMTGGIDFNPAMSQVGQQTPVSLRALVRNAGNIALPAGSYELVFSDASNTVVYTAMVNAPELAVNGLYEPDFGQWLPTQSGNLHVTLTNMAAPQAGQIVDQYYVGDVAQASFTVDQSTFSEGNNTVPGHINVQGVDVTQAAITDPLYTQVKTALGKAGTYVGDEASTIQRTRNCYACHVQSQSLNGLASANTLVPMNAAHMAMMYNAITSTQLNSGAISANHPTASTILGLWSLSAWQNKDESYRTRVQALEYLWPLSVVTSGQRSWNSDYAVGWLAPNYQDGATAIMAYSIRHLIEDRNQVSADAKSDYASTTLTTQGSSQAWYGMHNDGETIWLARNGGIDKYDIVTGIITPFYIDTYGRDVFDVVKMPDGTFYATLSNYVLHIDSAGMLTNWYAAGSNLRDIQLWNSALFFTDIYSHRVLKLDPATGVISVFTNSGLNVPIGLAVSPDNRLVVANDAGYNILSFDLNGNSIVLGEGIDMPPSGIVSVGDGSYYITTTHQANNNLMPSAVYHLRANGTIERLISNPLLQNTHTYHPIAVADDNLLIGDFYNRKLVMVNTQPLNDDIVATAQAHIPEIANYLLAKADLNPTTHWRTALKLYGLAQLKPLITDQALLIQVNTTLARLDARLRAAQNPNGGWSWDTNTVGQQGDPVTTSWAGLALDAMNPAVGDLVVRKSIMYLLSREAADGSWPSTVDNNSSHAFFTTSFGSTGLVMAYLPVALDHLGGFDVGLDLDTRPDVGLSNPSLLPATITVNSDGGKHYHWNLNHLTSDGAQIDFTLSINNLVLGEVRPVAESAQVSFANSFSGETITRQIDIPTVTAISGVTLQSTTNQSQYPANAVVQIADTVQNTGAVITNAVLQTTIRTSGGAIVAVLPDQAVASIAAGGSFAANASWNTGASAAGAYQAYTRLVDNQGRVLTDSVVNFSITASDSNGGAVVTYASAVHTNKLNYQPYDSVQIFSRVQNRSVNATQAAVLAMLQVTDSQGNTALATQWVVPAMVANGLLDHNNQLSLSNAAPGNYSVSLTVWNADITAVLTSSSYQFTVVDNPLAHLTGSITASLAVVDRGQALTCTDVLQNRSGTADVTLGIERALLKLDDQSVIQTSTQEQTLSVGQVATQGVGVDTATLEAGSYTCVLLAHNGNVVTTLAYANFEVRVQQQVKLEYSSQIGLQGRLLVLLDAADYKDALDKTSIAQQQAWLEPWLTAQGWSYTIVHNAIDFEREFSTGQYVVYALLANRVTLPQVVQSALASAIQSGEGLVMAGEFNRRNNHLEKALGIKLTGREQQASGALLSAGVLGTGLPAETFNPAHKLDIDHNAGDVLAIWQGVSGHHGDGHNDTDEHDSDHDSHHDNEHGSGHENNEHHGDDDHHGSDHNDKHDHDSHDDGHGSEHGNTHNDNHSDHRGEHGDEHGADHNEHQDCDDTQPTAIEPALVHHAYGTGHTVFAGFDLVDEAAAANTATSVYARMFAWSLLRVQPQPLSRIANNALPVLVHVNNTGVATQVRFTLTASGGAIVEAQGWAQANGTVQYLGTLAKDGSVNLPVVYVTSGAASDATVTLVIDTRPDDNTPWSPYITETWSVVTLP